MLRCSVDCIHGPIDIDGRGQEALNMSDEEKKGLQLYINPARMYKLWSLCLRIS